MTVDWKKRYSFRLKEEDSDIYHFLEQVQNSKRSETIRKMLKYAYQQMNGEQDKRNEYKLLLKKMKVLEALQKNNHASLIEKLEEGSTSLTGLTSQKIEPAASNEAESDSAIAMLSSFGVDLD